METNSTACYPSKIRLMSMIGESFFRNISIDRLGVDLDLALEMSPELNTLLKSEKFPGSDKAFLPYLPHLLAMIVIVTAAFRVLHLSLRCIRMPLVICQLISGIVVFSFISKSNGEIAIGDEILMSTADRRLEYIIGILGILFNLFLAGVKLDYSIVWQFKKKEPFIMGSSSLFVPLVVGSLVHNSLVHEDLTSMFGGKKGEFLLKILYPLCTTYPISQSDIFTELGLLNTELGRLALSSSMTQCAAGWIFIISLTVYLHASLNLMKGLKVFLSFLGLFAVIMLVIMPYARWIVRTTPHNARVRDVHIFLIMLTVFIIALVSDGIGFRYVDGPIIMGLTIPPGPPLGTALIERVDFLASELFLPIAFMNEGFYIDWAGFKQKLGFMMRIQLLVVVTSIAKIAANTVAAMYCNKTLKEGLLVGLMMNCRGLIDMLVFLSLTRVGLIDRVTFTAIVLPIIAITAICAPIISFCYKPLNGKKQISTSCRAIQHVHSHAELRVMTCFYDDKPIPAFLEFLKYVSSPDIDNPLSIYTLYLIELQACYTSSLISHGNKRGYINTAQMDIIHNHFINFKMTKKDGVITVLPFTSMTPLKTMHQDVSTLVLERDITFVIVPYPKKNSMAEIEGIESMRGFVPLVLEHVQCSIGIMVYTGTTRIRDPGHWQYHIGVLFWGGPDDREALSIASRLACHPDVCLSILCFITTEKTDNNQQRKNKNLEKHHDNQQRKNKNLEKHHDNQVIANFRAANYGNNRVLLSKVRVGNLEEASRVINAVGHKYDLLIVGRRQEWMLKQDENLEQWINSPELGVIGDMLVTDNSCTGNVLVVQQHTL